MIAEEHEYEKAIDKFFNKMASERDYHTIAFKIAKRAGMMGVSQKDFYACLREITNCDFDSDKVSEAICDLHNNKYIEIVEGRFSSDTRYVVR